jgi:hypothetical protein
MKGKMTIVLLSLVLVFGMIAASCDDGEYASNPYKTDPNKSARDWVRSPLVPKVAQPDIQLSTTMTAIGNGMIKDDAAGRGKIAGTPVQFVGASELTITGGAVAIEAKDSWGGGIDVKIGTGADKINLLPDAKVVVKTAAGATGTWVLRIKTDDYNGGSDTAITAGTDTEKVLSAADLDKIAAGNGCIRINTSANGSTITVTDIIFTNYDFAD